MTPEKLPSRIHKRENLACSIKHGSFICNCPTRTGNWERKDMVVKGLLEYIVSSGHRRRVQLSLLASDFLQETGKHPKLLLDFGEVGKLIWSSPIKVLQRLGDYPTYTSVCGPDFHLVDDRARCFVRALKCVGVEPVFFIAKPGYRLSDRKVLARLKGKRDDRLSKCYAMQQVLEHTVAQSSLHTHCCDLKRRQLHRSLREEGAELVFCSEQPTPQAIAQYARSHDDVCGIVSNTPDFALIGGCVLFPLVEFDCDEMTGLRGGVSIVENPPEIVAMATTPAALAESLGIREEQLPELAVLCGTEHTASFLSRLSVLTALGLEGSDVEDVAAWLKTREAPLMESEAMQELVHTHPEFGEAIECSYRVFAVDEQQNGGGPPEHASPVYELVEREMKGYGDIAFAAAKQGIVWLNVPYENLTLGQPSILNILCPLRKAIYGLLGVRKVYEYGRGSSGSQACRRMKIDVCGSEDEVRSSVEHLQLVRGLDPCTRLAAVYSLSTMLSVRSVGDVIQVVDYVAKNSFSFPEMDWPKLHKLAFLCCSLRLIALLNKSSWPSLSIGNGELDALLLASLTCATEGTLPPHIVHVLPSVKAVSVGEWFCTVMDSVYEMSYLLGVTEASPEPRNVFYPMSFMPYHIALQPHSNLTPRQSKDIESVKTAMQLALSLPSVKEFSSCVFDTDKQQTLPDLIIKCDAALNEILQKEEQLLPRTATATAEELFGLSESSEDETGSDEESGSESVSEGGKKRPEPRPAVWEKEELPIMEHCETILDLISTHQMVCIEGETGCGKSSQVPQFILKHFPNSRVLASQPSYLAAKKLAERVSHELAGEITVKACDDLQIDDSDARLVYGTNKFMLKVCICCDGMHHSHNMAMVNCVYT